MNIPIVHIEMVNNIPMIKGRGIKVRMIAEMHLEGSATIESLMEHYRLSPAEVHSALAYYYDHRETFEQTTQAVESLLEAAKHESKIGLEKMQMRAKKSKS